MTNLSNLNDIQFLKCIVICKESGEYLLDLIFDHDMNPVILSSFLGALSVFSKDGLGKLTQVVIKGLHLNMIIINKNNLVLLCIIDKNYMSDKIMEDSEKALDMFHLLYKNDIEKYSLDTNRFESFKNILLVQMQEYLEEFFLD